MLLVSHYLIQLSLQPLCLCPPPRLVSHTTPQHQDSSTAHGIVAQTYLPIVYHSALPYQVVHAGCMQPLCLWKPALTGS
jgi:hypothetical protein